jgi:DNA-binding protein H-NS
MDAEKLRRKEMDGVIGRIREAITVYNLTAEDLGFGGKAKKAAGKAAAPAKRGKAKAAAPKAPAEVKYQNETGGTWGGRGKRPQWLRDALARRQAIGRLRRQEVIQRWRSIHRASGVELGNAPSAVRLACRSPEPSSPWPPA